MTGYDIIALGIVAAVFLGIALIVAATVLAVSKTKDKNQR